MITTKNEISKKKQGLMMKPLQMLFQEPCSLLQNIVQNN